MMVCNSKQRFSNVIYHLVEVVKSYRTRITFKTIPRTVSTITPSIPNTFSDVTVFCPPFSVYVERGSSPDIRYFVAS